ncbi:ATP--cob(I)alamin adenosyltransferase [Ferrimonas balearica]|uniref:ATP--cob(I)alamin adenosyltransferase n=1 Tax=Ferrimonas balearica TaxID=44012 RepID=UPI001C998851|nr:ATP--cob(I)alamin adenosyltransferase [Ferrimonas balearica]MBY5992559.1 ATP--cob(I)alamin adenosyltransferase [Ferrimonas balearica]
MPRRLSADKRELCYPFIFESGPSTDFEVQTDELCSQIGYALALLASELSEAQLAELKPELHRVQALVYHLNGSVRGKLAVSEADLDWLKARYDHHHGFGTVGGFVLPTGSPGVMALHLCRSGAKKSIRQLVRCEEAGLMVHERLLRLANLLTNYFFCLTVRLKAQLGQEEIPFQSQSY